MEDIRSYRIDEDKSRDDERKRVELERTARERDRGDDDGVPFHIPRD